VRRPEPARHDDEISRQRLGEGALELGLVVADDRDLRRLEAEQDELPCEERPVAVVPVAADELAAGDDDDAAQDG
jgi:hypothetical protein